MYEVFYNFKAEPFRLSPDHKFCYEHNSYAKARAYMAYAFKRAEGFVMITGRPGTGKTTLIGELVESLEKDKVATANLVCTQLQADDLLKTVAFSFGIGSQRADKAELLQRLNVLFQRWHREGRRALLVVDEAQDLSPSAMEELRLLTNIQLGGQPLLQIFLLGQPELRDLILSPEMEQVHQRIVAATHIEGLEADETEAYVLHRLQAVGWHGDPAIDRAIFPAIHKFSEGVPRRINLICSRLFLLGSVEQRHDINVDDVRVVIGELQAENLAAGTSVSTEDFVALGETQWVPVPQERVQEQERPEVYLKAVNSESFPSPDIGSAAAGGGSKKKDTAFVKTNRKTAENNDSLELDAPGSAFDADSPDEPHENFAPDLPVVATESRSAATAESNDDRTSRRVARATPRSGWIRAIALCSFVLMIIALLFFLESFVSGQNQSVYGDLELRPTADPAYNQQPAPTGLKPEASVTSLEEAGAIRPSAERTKISDLPDDNVAFSAAVEMSEPQVAAESGRLSNARAFGDELPTNSSPQFPDPIDRIDQSSPGLSGVQPGTVQTPDAGKIAFAAKTFLVNFSFDSDDLLAESQPALDRAVAMMRENPESKATIKGFADIQGDETYNLGLSRMRAEAVEEYLVDEGIARRRLQVEGMGAFIGPEESSAPDLTADMEQYRVVQITIAEDLRP